MLVASASAAGVHPPQVCTTQQPPNPPRVQASAHVHLPGGELVCPPHLTPASLRRPVRIFCDWNQRATATGRLSSSNPNLQVRTGGVRGSQPPGAPWLALCLPGGRWGACKGLQGRSLHVNLASTPTLQPHPPGARKAGREGGAACGCMAVGGGSSPRKACLVQAGYKACQGTLRMRSPSPPPVAPGWYHWTAC